MIIPKKEEGPQLVAELGVFSSADALQWARSSRLTGRLSFRHDDARITLLFERGCIIYAASRDGRVAFGRHLVSEGLVDEVDLAATMVFSRSKQMRIGAALIGLGVLDEALVRAELHEHTLNLATLPLSWTEGWVCAERTESDHRLAVMPEPVDTIFLLMEAARRIDEITAMRKLLPDDDLSLEPGDVELPAETSLRQHRTLEMLEPQDTLGRLFERIGGSHYRFLETVHGLVRTGVLTVRAPEGAELLESSPLESLSLAG